MCIDAIPQKKEIINRSWKIIIISGAGVADIVVAADAIDATDRYFSRT